MDLLVCMEMQGICIDIELCQYKMTLCDLTYTNRITSSKLVTFIKNISLNSTNNT